MLYDERSLESRGVVVFRARGVVTATG